MKNYKSILLGTIISLTGMNTYAQGPSLPAASPAASVSQVFGLTKIEINYSSPAVKGRTIWGSLVPYDSVWRTGANKATDITFSTDVTIGGQAVKKGKYALFTIPGRNSWTIILNSDADQFGAFDYKKSLDVARFTVTPTTSFSKERLSFFLDPVSDSVCTVILWWEKLNISFNVTANTKALVKKNIDDYADNGWRNYANSANYYVDNNLDLKKAHNWAQVSIDMKDDHFFNHYVMAKVIHAEGDNKEALKYATEAKRLGEKDSNQEFYNAYKDRIAKLIADLGGAKK
jgi:hypothetical protein